MQNRIKEFLLANGAGQVGFCRLKEKNPFGMSYAISYTIPLLDAVVDTIGNAPTHTYFHHYRSVNAHIDNTSLRLGLMLQREGYLAAPVPASQSVNGLQGIFSHKYAAAMSGLGAVGKSGLFVSDSHGPRVRLGTVLTDYMFETEEAAPECRCGNCNLCMKACPAMAITGQAWQAGHPREEILDAKACSDYMKRHFQQIGRGAVCGICMQVCPKGKTR